jgi:hypothetical protein
MTIPRPGILEMLETPPRNPVLTHGDNLQIVRPGQTRPWLKALRTLVMVFRVVDGVEITLQTTIPVAVTHGRAEVQRKPPKVVGKASA